MIKKILAVIGVTAIAVMLISVPCLASYSEIISINNTSGTTYTETPFMVSQNNSYLATNNYIDSTGLDVDVAGNAGLVPAMLTAQETWIVPPSLSTSSSYSYSWSSGNSDTFTNGTGVATGSPITLSLSSAINTVNIVTAGSFTLQANTQLVTVVSGTATVTGSPVLCSYGANVIQISGTGNIKVYLSMPIVEGYGGYITVPENAALEPGGTFSISANGYLNTTAGANENIVSKASALQVNVDPTTSGMIDASINTTLSGSLVVYFRSALSNTLGGTEQVRSVLYNGSSYQYGSWIAVASTSFVTVSNTWATNPWAGGAWTTSVVNSMQIGIEQQSSPPAGYGIDVYTSWVYATIGGSTINPSGAGTISHTGTGTFGIYPPTLAAWQAVSHILPSDSSTITTYAADPNSYTTTITFTNSGVSAYTASIVGVVSGVGTLTASLTTTSGGLLVLSWLPYGGSVISSSVIGVGVVPSNSNIWYIDQNNVMPWINYYTETVGATEVLRYQPQGILTNPITAYTSSTATFTNASATVTGAGTGWIAAMTGGQIEGTDGVFYTIHSVESATSLTLTIPFADTTESGVSYTLNYYVSTALSDLDSNQNGTLYFGVNPNLGVSNSVNVQPIVSGFSPLNIPSFYSPPVTTVPDLVGIASSQGGAITSYTVGTATFTNGSKLVTGTGTSWISTMQGGQIALDVDGQYFTVAGVTSATNLSLTSAYTNTGGTGNYVMQYLSGGSNAEDTLQTTNLLTPWFQPWANITNIPLIGFFVILAAAIMVLVLTFIMQHTQNQFIASIVLIMMESFCYKLGIYQFWWIVVSGLICFAVLLWERKPAL